MDLEFSQEDFGFQTEVRDWIKENYPEEMRKQRHLRKEDHIYWQQALYERGWAGLKLSILCGYTGLILSIQSHCGGPV